MSDPRLLSVVPLPAPINAFRHVAAELKAAAANLPATTPEEQRQHSTVRGIVDWLEHLGSKVDFQTDKPVLAAAIGALALDVKTRRAFRAALDQVDAVTNAAEAQR